MEEQRSLVVVTVSSFRRDWVVLNFAVGTDHLVIDARRPVQRDPAEFLHVREALARVDRGESFATIADDTGIAESTLRSLHQDRRDLYLGGEAEDERVDNALTDVRPLEDVRAEDPDFEELRERVERLEEATDIDNC